jgi:hypothetical protein
MRKTLIDVKAAVRSPETVFAFQHGDDTRKVRHYRETPTGRLVVTFDDGAVCRYCGTEQVYAVR